MLTSFRIFQNNLGRSIHSKPFVPKTIHDMDIVANEVLSAGIELDSEHPGFKDPVYLEQRETITKIANNFQHGQIIPEISYQDENVATWQNVYSTLQPLYTQYASIFCNKIVYRHYKKCPSISKLKLDFPFDRLTDSCRLNTL